MKAREQPNGDRGPRIPHVLRAAHEKSSRQQPRAHVQAPENTGCQRTHRLAGNQQRTSPPQSGASEDHGDVTQMQKIGPPPYAHIGGKPHHHPNKTDPSQNWKGGGARGHASSPLDASNAAQPTTGGCSCMQRVNSDHSKRVSGGTIPAGNTREVAAGGHDGSGKDWGSPEKTTTNWVKKRHAGKSF